MTNSLSLLASRRASATIRALTVGSKTPKRTKFKALVRLLETASVDGASADARHIVNKMCKTTARVESLLPGLEMVEGRLQAGVEHIADLATRPSLR